MTPDLLLSEYGLWGLCVLAFLGATILPISSEIGVVAALSVGLPPVGVFLSASLGNALGATLTYGLGRWPARRMEHALQRSRGGRAALAWTRRYGPWGLLGSWLPVVGDPLCLTAGLLRVRVRYFVLLGLGTRIVRYGVLILAFG